MRLGIVGAIEYTSMRSLNFHDQKDAWGWKSTILTLRTFLRPVKCAE
jgi:hypothetical protein